MGAVRVGWGGSHVGVTTLLHATAVQCLCQSLTLCVGVRAYIFLCWFQIFNVFSANLVSIHIITYMSICHM